MGLKKLLLCLFLFLVLADFLTKKRGWPQAYSPMYDFAHDPVFSYIRKSPSQGTILAGLVHSYKGLNFQVATGKQFFVPIMTSHTFHGQSFMIYCHDNFTQGYEELVKEVVTCFHNRSKEEWQLIAQATDVNLVAVFKGNDIPALKKVASDNDFDLYEIETIP